MTEYREAFAAALAAAREAAERGEDLFDAARAALAAHYPRGVDTDGDGCVDEGIDVADGWLWQIAEDASRAAAAELEG